MLALRWGDLEGLEEGCSPLKLTFYGRKRHKKAYFTFMGKDAVEHLKLWAEKWKEDMGRPPEPRDLVFLGKQRSGMDCSWLNYRFREMALRLAKQGIVANGAKQSWHSHYLRHSFKTEAEHAGVKSAMVEYWMGHAGGISQVYDNRDELHDGDFLEAYRKLEPHVSLDLTEAILYEQFNGERQSWIAELTSLRREVARLAGLSSRMPRAFGEAQVGQPLEP